MSIITKEIRTNSAQRNPALQPIVIKMGATSAMRKVEEVLNGYGFEILSLREDYHEIYACITYYELTFTFVEDFNKTHLSILCYSEKKPFGIKKTLTAVMSFLREKLEGVIE